jgi:hypothetical protein
LIDQIADWVKARGGSGEATLTPYLSLQPDVRCMNVRLEDELVELMVQTMIRSNAVLFLLPVASNLSSNTAGVQH